MNKGILTAKFFALMALLASTQFLAALPPESAEAPPASQASQEPAPVKRPNYSNVRYDEDWSVLRNSQSTSGYDKLKFIPLNDGGSVFLSIGGQARIRLENWADFGFGGPGSRDDTFGLLRLRLHGNLNLGSHFRLFVEGKSATATGRDLPGGLRTLEVDSIDLQNTFVEVSAPLEEGKISLRVGRQELQFGKQRLVSPLDWSNTRPRLFDGARATFKVSGWQVDGFFSRFARVHKYSFNGNNTGTDFFGLYATGKPAPALTVDLYWLGLDRTNSIWGGVSGEEERHTAGGRLGGKIGKTSLDFDFEGALQWGDHGSRDISAFMLASQLGYSFPVLSGSRVWLGFDLGSGDSDPSDNEVGTFNQLFPLGHAYLGFVDAIGRQNIADLNQGAAFQVTRRANVRVDSHFFWRVEDEDAVYNAGGGVLRAGNPLLPQRVGWELDWTLRFGINRHTVFTAGYSHFFPGPFIEESGPDNGIDFSYLAIQYTF